MAIFVPICACADNAVKQCNAEQLEVIQVAPKLP